MKGLSPLSAGGVTLGITPRQREVLVCIARLFERLGRAPSFPELRDEAGYRSTSRAQEIAVAMARRGWLDHVPARKRSIRLTGAAVSLLASMGVTAPAFARSTEA
jgi:SOS-response transcriptional repressor LexA